MKRPLVVLLLVVVFAGITGITAWLVLRHEGGHDHAGGGAAQRYHCPMHPQIVKDGPGSCPVCGMDLAPVPSSEPAPAPRPIYHCPMHPQIVKDGPGSCPICGMDLVPAPIEPLHDGHEASASAQSPAGLATIRLSEQKLRRIGARTATAEVAPFAREIRAFGRLAVNETRLRQVHTKSAGFVERLYVDAVGERVTRGQPLVDLYSPELLAAQQEYLVARSARERLAGSDLESVRGSGDELLLAARRRLELLDVPAAEIDALDAGAPARRTVTLRSPIGGTVLERFVAQGARIEPGTEIVRVADLSSIWVLASIYEYELPFVREGTAATMSLDFLPGREFAGTVSFVYPTLDPATRTAQVRLEFPNPDGVLKPEMFSTVRIQDDLGPRLAIPSQSVMDTGARRVVFVDLGDGAFEPREVQIGTRLPDRVEILSGLVAGERVLAEGNFFIDSESRLKAALAASARGGTADAAPTHQH